MYDREAFYAELRERHRNLTHRQRLAREFFEQQQRRQQQQQQQQHQVQRRAETAYRQQEGYEVQDPAKRQRVVIDTRAQQFRRQMQLQGEAAAASRHLRPPSYPPPASQLVASMVPRVNAPLSLERRFREPDPLAEVDAGSRIGRVDQQRLQMQAQMQMRAASALASSVRPLSAGSVQRAASPGPRPPRASPCRFRM